MNPIEDSSAEQRTHTPNASSHQALDTSPTTKIMLADDDVRVRSAIQFRLACEPGLRIVQEATDVGTLLARAEAVLPDILLLDWELPGLGFIGAGKQLMRTLRLWIPEMKIIALSSHLESKQDALLASADAFVSKTEPAATLLHTLNSLRLPTQSY